MKIGAMNHPAGNPLEEIEWIGRHKFDFVDFTFEPPAADPSLIDSRAIRAVLERHGLGVVAHTAWYLPLGWPFASIRAACLSEFRRALQAANGLGAKVMNVHYTKPLKFFSPEKLVDWHVEVLTPLCSEAAALGMTIVLEHVPFAGRDQLESIASILDRLSLLRFHLDSGHAKLERDYDRWEEYLDRLGRKLLHVHLSENDGTADQHLPLGAAPRSTTDWPLHIKKLKGTGYDGTITLEVFTTYKEHLLLSRELLRKWWGEV
ncbi:MAG TPA: sugar phosphate isomerase/epimerase family protein [Gemmataceae bacterium]|nr:sugar phosphate isomerase/epimerase family protein [Gemmataceae bacterium]